MAFISQSMQNPIHWVDEFRFCFICGAVLVNFDVIFLLLFRSSVGCSTEWPTREFLQIIHIQ